MLYWKTFFVTFFFLAGCSSIVSEYKSFIQPSALKTRILLKKNLKKLVQKSKISKPFQSITDKQIKTLLIKQSINIYSGSCPCPYFSDRAGRRCGRRSAWSRPGGASPFCYDSDISDEMIKKLRNSLSSSP